MKFKMAATMKVHAKLTISVVYDNAETQEQVRQILLDAASYLANHGLLSEDNELIVDEWNSKVETK